MPRPRKSSSETSDHTYVFHDDGRVDLMGMDAEMVQLIMEHAWRFTSRMVKNKSSLDTIAKLDRCKEVAKTVKIDLAEHYEHNPVTHT